MVYCFEDYVETNSNGLFTVVVGENFPQYDSIDWSNGPYFLISEMGLDNGNNYELSTVQQIMSVPYAEHARVADHVVNNFVCDEHDPYFTSWGFRYDSLVGVPTNLSQLHNDLYYLRYHPQPDIIHIHSLFVAKYAIVLKEEFSFLTVLTEHWAGLNTGVVDKNNLSEKHVYQNVDSVIVVSKALQVALKDFLMWKVVSFTIWLMTVSLK